MRSGTIGKTLIALGITIAVYVYNMSVYSDGYLSFPSISERQNLLIVAGTLFIGGIILFAVDNLKQTKDENAIESSRQLATEEPEIFKMVATRKSWITAIALYFGIFGIIYIASSYTRKPPNKPITAATETITPVSLPKDESNPITVDCGGARSQMSFEKSPWKGGKSVTLKITVSLGGRSITKRRGPSDYVSLDCVRTKSGRDLVVYEGACGGSGCKDFNFMGIIDPMNLQVLLDPGEETYADSETVERAMEILGPQNRESAKWRSLSQVEEALYKYHDVKSAVLDGKDSVGRTIRLSASFIELGTSAGQPAILIKVDTDTSLNLWEASLGENYKSKVSDLKKGQRLTVDCEILDLNALTPKCKITEWL